jgi:hypothetical protein
LALAGHASVDVDAQVSAHFDRISADFNDIDAPRSVPLAENRVSGLNHQNSERGIETEVAESGHYYMTLA